MAQLIVRELDESVKERLKARAKRHGRTLEAEARAILEEAANGRPPAKRAPKSSAKRRLDEEKGFGTRMHELFKEVGLTKEERAQFEEGIRKLWRKDPPRFVDFQK